PGLGRMPRASRLLPAVLLLLLSGCGGAVADDSPDHPGPPGWLCGRVGEDGGKVCEDALLWCGGTQWCVVPGTVCAEVETYHPCWPCWSEGLVCNSTFTPVVCNAGAR